VAGFRYTQPADLVQILPEAQKKQVMVSTEPRPASFSWYARSAPQFIYSRCKIPIIGGRIRTPLEKQRDFADAQPADLVRIPNVQ
jgi:hypothetical protein